MLLFELEGTALLAEHDIAKPRGMLVGRLEETGGGKPDCEGLSDCFDCKSSS